MSDADSTPREGADDAAQPAPQRPPAEQPAPERPASEQPAAEASAPPPAAPATAPEWPTTWIAPGPTTPVDATPTVVPAPEPTRVDPLAPPDPRFAPPTGPAYGAPPPPSGPAYGAPPPPPPPSYGAPPPPTYGAPPPPAYGAPPGWTAGALPGVAGWGAVPQAPKPGVVPLRPLGVGEILDGAIGYIRRDPRTVLGISAVIALVQAALQFVALLATSGSLSAASTAATPEDVFGGLLGSLTATIVQGAVGAVLGVLATGLLTVVMGQAVLGRRVTAAEAWRRTRPRFWPLLGLTLLVSLIVGVAVALSLGLAIGVGVAVGQGAGSAEGVLLGAAVFLAGAAVSAWLYVKLLLAPVALILEAAPVGTSMRRSWSLVQGAWWRTFGIYVLGSVLASIVSSVLVIPFSVVGAITSINQLESGGALPLSYTISMSLATLVASTIVVPFSAGIVALLYVDRRIRREALDLELARAAGVGGGAAGG